MHERTRHDTSNCPIANTLEIVGEKWTLLILRESMYGVTRYADFQQVLGCPRNLLAERLQMLVEYGIFAAQPYQEPGERTRQEYRMTEKGARLIPVLQGLLEWGEEYLPDPDGAAVLVEHRNCGHRVELAMTCGCGHHMESASELELKPGPAFRLKSDQG
jgi:DNA-binding HxlR family transcriptional regulator